MVTGKPSAAQSHCDVLIVFTDMNVRCDKTLLRAALWITDYDTGAVIIPVYISYTL